VKKKIIIAGIVAVVLAVFVVANLLGRREKTVEVEAEAIQKRDLSAIVTASGEVQPKKSVDVSANTMGKIVHIAVAEGDSVKKGQLLMRIDPRGLESVLAQAKAGLTAAKANLALYEANLEEAKSDKERVERLYERGLASDQQLVNARTANDVAVANVAAARGEIARQEAYLSSAQYELSKVTIDAEISGVVTRLNVEEGENAITGTMNNPGTVLMTISDLSQMEAEVLVDETDVVNVHVGQDAKINIDAFPDTSFKGRVTEVGHSAVVSQGSYGREESADFEVKVSLLEPVENIRPGLSASADIVTAVRDSVPSVPIQSLTIRSVGDKKSDKEKPKAGEKSSNEKAGVDTSAESASDTSGVGAGTAAGGEKAGDKTKEKQGVFVVEDGRAVFKPVEVGIAGERYFEVLSGVEVGQQVIRGPFKILRGLKDGASVKVKKQSKNEEE
jgi:HlyD family secretion protein